MGLRDLTVLDEVREARTAAQLRILARTRTSAKMLTLLADHGIDAMRFRRFTYDSRQWSRLEAWQHLTAQQIPGAPQRANTSRVPWRKAHSIARHEWAWIYVG